jgi:hypothetical protein
LQLDLSCPLELVGYDLTHDGRGARGFVHLTNLSDKPVTGFEAVITWQGENGDVDIPLTSGVILAPPHTGFVLPIETVPAPSGQWTGLSFVRIDFDGAPSWRGNPKRFTDVATPEKPSPRELEALKRVAGPDAAVRPVLAKDYWVCVCGRANPLRNPGCDRCGRSKRSCLKIGAQFSEAFKEKKTQKGKKGTEGIKKTSARSAFSHKVLRARYLRQRSLLIRRTVTMLTAAGLIALIALTWAWLADMQQRARELVPPTRIEETQSNSDPGAPGT